MPFDAEAERRSLHSNTTLRNRHGGERAGSNAGSGVQNVRPGVTRKFVQLSAVRAVARYTCINRTITSISVLESNNQKRK